MKTKLKIKKLPMEQASKLSAINGGYCYLVCPFGIGNTDFSDTCEIRCQGGGGRAY